MYNRSIIFSGSYSSKLNAFVETFIIPSFLQKNFLSTEHPIIYDVILL
jgi:hypothetical protein